jgi:hypothetical protein
LPPGPSSTAACFFAALARDGCTSLALIEALLARFGLGSDIRRTTLAAARVLVLAFVVQLFVRHVVIGQISIATPLSAQQQESIRLATERLWSLLCDMKPAKPGPLYVAFSSPYPVTSATIQLYAAQAKTNLVIRNELIARMDADKSLCLLQTQTFPDVTLRVYRRGC